MRFFRSGKARVSMASHKTRGTDGAPASVGRRKRPLVPPSRSADTEAAASTNSVATTAYFDFMAPAPLAGLESVSFKTLPGGNITRCCRKYVESSIT